MTIRIIALALLVCFFAGCTTTATFDAFGNKTSETRSIQITAEHIAALEALHAILVESVEALVDLKGTIDDAEYNQELAEREAKAAEMAAKIDALKELLAVLPKPPLASSSTP